MAETCTGEHCSQVQGNVNDICKAEKWPIGHLVLVCNPITGKCCNCKCSCALWDTPVAIENGSKAIQEFAVGDTVLASDTSTSAWSSVVVEFSDGTGGDVPQPEMVYITVQGGDQLVVTRDHVVVVADSQGKRWLKQAQTVVVGDSLIRQDNSVVEVSTVTVQPSTKGVHHISTGTSKPQTLDGHILAMGGFACGDYVIQLYWGELPPESTYPNHDLLPVVGSPKYIQAHGDGAAPSTRGLADALGEYGDPSSSFHFAQYRPDAPRSVGEGPAVLLNTDTTTVIQPPAGSSAFVTEKQAQEIAAKPAHSFDDPTLISSVRWLFQIYGAFYPDIIFSLDWTSPDGNGYAGELEGKPFVMLEGGLVRCLDLGLEGISIILAHLIGRIRGGDPVEANGLSCRGRADYFAVAAVQRGVWWGELYPTITFPGIAQMAKLFSGLSDEAAAPGSPCVEPTLACRVQTYQAAFALEYEPACAGGPTKPYLTVESAEGVNPTLVVVNFDKEVNPESAQVADNYTISPPVVIDQAGCKPEHPTQVGLNVSIEPGIKYTLSVSNVIARDGSQLDSRHSTAQFELPQTAV